jgi:hypoxanthine phosphoribosyltransferase
MKLKDKTFEKVIPYERIADGIDSVAARLNEDYGGLDGPPPLFIGVLNGAFMFMSELMQRLDFQCEVTFVKLSSYRGTHSTGTVAELIGLAADVEGRHVVVVEDIVETGESIDYLMRSLEGHRPASVEVASLLFKPESYAREKAIKYSAMSIPNDFIVGFGLDYDGVGRNLRDIYKVVDE